MRRRGIGMGRGLLLAAALVLVAGCVDIDPVYVPQPVFDAGPREDSAQPNACDMCLATPNQPGPGCGDEVAICLTDPRCVMVMECTAPLRCYEKPTQAEVNDCGTPCFQMVVGNTFPTDLIAMLLNVAACAQGTCGAVCRAQ